MMREFTAFGAVSRKGGIGYLCFLAMSVIVLECSCVRHGNMDDMDSGGKRAKVCRLMHAAGRPYGFRYDCSGIRGPLTIAQIEQELSSGDVDHLADTTAIPFSVKETWTQLKNSYVEGDEFYFFTSDRRSWRQLSGREGYVLIRQDTIVGKVVTAMN